jgi:hypothetical protein
VSEAVPRFEDVLRDALPPVEPREGFTMRLEDALTGITEIAAGELESWELSAMRDPRNWGRPAAALVIGGTAATALVLLRARRRQQAARASRSGPGTARDLAERTLGDLGEEVRKLLGSRHPLSRR